MCLGVAGQRETLTQLISVTIKEGANSEILGVSFNGKINKCRLLDSPLPQVYYWRHRCLDLLKGVQDLCENALYRSIDLCSQRMQGEQRIMLHR